MKIQKPILVLLGIVTGIISVTAQERMSRTYTGIDEIEISVSSGDAVFKKGEKPGTMFKMGSTIS